MDATILDIPRFMGFPFPSCVSLLPPEDCQLPYPKPVLIHVLKQ